MTKNLLSFFVLFSLLSFLRIVIVINNVSAADESTTTASSSKASSSSSSYYPYQIWDPSKIVTKLKEWNEKYSESFVTLITAQDEYGLDRAGTSKDCPFDENGDGCINYILTIQDLKVHPIGSESSNALPEVFWSGCVHGNERVGPTAVMEATTLLLESAQCESISKPIEEANACRRLLERKYGIDNDRRQWLARLVTTRRIVVLPTANAVGYYRNTREDELLNDPNRDFPFDYPDGTKCMKTIAARTINEVMRRHIFQLGLTFHGGMEVVAYEWGAPSYYRFQSPDDTAQAQIAGAYSNYGGGWRKSHPYEVGTMNDKVYYVRGGMEDWAYAGSWVPELVIPCEPTTYSPYAKERTVYNNATLRVFNMLVETSNHKTPEPSMLGTSQEVLNKDFTEGNGHISRNIRLSLLSADLVQPYVRMVVVNDLALSDDIVPMSVSPEPIRVMIPKHSQTISVEWTVGGALDIDETTLWTSSSSHQSNTLFRTREEAIQKGFQPQEQQEQKLMSGKGYFSAHGPQPHPSSSRSFDSNEILGPVFVAELDVSNLKNPGDSVTVAASARVDNAWTTTQFSHSILKPDSGPQSHVVNARTNPDWYFEVDSSDGMNPNGYKKVVRGQVDWFSQPLTIVVGDYDDTIGLTPAGRKVTTVEVSKRFNDDNKNVLLGGGVKPSSSTTNNAGRYPVLVIGFVLATIFIGGVLVKVHQQKNDPRNEYSSSVHGDDDDEYDDDDDESEGEDGSNGQNNSLSHQKDVELSNIYRDVLSSPSSKEL